MACSAAVPARTAVAVLASLALCLTLSVTLFGCGAPKMDCHTQDGKAALLDAVQNALTSQDCTTAIDLIEPVYLDKECTNDEVRIARASSYACAANINFFKLIGDITKVNLNGKVFWPAMTQLFPSVPTDSRVAAGELSLDALFALKAVGAIATPLQQVNASSANPGYLLASQRSVDSNLYGIFISMSLIGAFQNRYGNPDLTTYAKQRNLGAASASAADLGWGDIMKITPDACSYATSVLTLVDSINEVSQQVSGKIGTSLSQVSAAFSAGLNFYCDLGCKGLLPGGTVASSCTIAAGCATCPLGLRNRSLCTTSKTDPVGCAAAGVAAFVNGNPLGWVP
ncbi:MAG: hypothetical protein H7222_01055 [Methylotenera sp.]|nr:hypothetical protein [Oligoflexia bacterium]